MQMGPEAFERMYGNPDEIHHISSLANMTHDQGGNVYTVTESGLKELVESMVSSGASRPQSSVR